jgi:hypothetical protein
MYTNDQWMKVPVSEEMCTDNTYNVDGKNTGCRQRKYCSISRGIKGKIQKNYKKMHL